MNTPLTPEQKTGISSTLGNISDILGKLPTAMQANNNVSLADRYANTPTVTESPLDKAKRELADQMKTQSATPSFEDVRAQIQQMMQAQIDATNRYYDDLVRKETAAGNERSAQTRGLNVRAGLSGSDFASANAAETTRKNNEAVDAINNERNMKVQELFTAINDQAKKEFETKKTDAQKNATDYISYLQGVQDDALNKFTSIAQTGLKLDRMKTEKTSTGESVYDYVKRTTGKTDLELEALYNANLPKPAQKDIHYEKVGNGKIAAFYVDDNGQIVRNEYDFAVPPDRDFQVVNGVPYFINKETGTMTPAKGYQPGLGGAGDEQLYAGLSGSTATAVRTKVSAFKTEPSIQNFSTIQDGRNFAASISNETKNPADDQALIYSLAKALDPGSVVREGEYATAQKYAQSWIKAYGKGVEQALLGTGFLSPEARKNIKQTIEQKFNASKKSYDNLYKQYQSGINALTGRSDGAKFLTDYLIPEEDPNVAELRALGYTDDQIKQLQSQ